jgi:hypothetical protein
MSILLGGLNGASGLLLTRGLGAGSIRIYATALEALAAWFSTQDDLQDLLSDGKLWEWEAPEGTRLPYAVVFEVSDVDELTTGDPFVEKVTLQFNFFASTALAAKTIGQAFKAALKNAPLMVDNQRVAHCLPNNALLTKAEGKGPGGKDVHMQMLEFEVMLARSTV